MDGEIQYYALSALCYPLMYWAVHGTLVTPWVGAEEASLASTVRGLLLSTLLLVVSWNYAGWAQYEARRRQLNCGPIKRAPLRDPVLGIDFLLESLASLRKHHILDFYTETFKRYRATTYTTKVLGRTVLMTDEPENLKAILSKKFEDFPIGGIRLDAVVPVLGKASIFSSNGEDWHKARSFLRPSFVRNQVADLPIFDRHIQNMLARIPADGETFDMKNLLQAMTMDVSTDFMLGYSTNLLKTVSPEAQQFLDDFDSSSVECATRARLGPILLKLPHPKVDAAARRMREYLGFYLRKAVADKTDLKDREYVFLNALLDSGASEGYIVDQILSVIVAGRDTTSAAMASCLWFLARDPAVWANLRREVKALGAENPSWEDLKNMKLLNQVVKETLRLATPIAANSRTAARETILPRGGGPDGKQPILVPKGMPVRWSSYSMHRSKEVYGQDADEFRPERWERDELRGIMWEYTPFSGGPRICVGQQFALTQITFMLFRFLQKFETIEAKDTAEFRMQASLASAIPDCLVAVTRA